jgi:organic radical activating enzyme
MLIQISNRCDEGCPHCLQDSREDGGLMSLETFKSAVRFGCETGWHLFLITGGEPTMNPDMERMLRWFDDVSQKMKRETGVPIMFAIATNGTWMEDAEKRRMMWRVARLKSYLFTQVYTNKRWYQDYDYIQDLRTELEQIPHCKVLADDQIWMQDLGRARTNADCQAEVEKNPYRCSCLNAALAAHQVRNPKDMVRSISIEGVDSQDSYSLEMVVGTENFWTVPPEVLKTESRYRVVVKYRTGDDDTWYIKGSELAVGEANLYLYEHRE